MNIFEQAIQQGQDASQMGFDWTSPHEVILKVLEESQELSEAIRIENTDLIRHEMGDVLLALSSLARHLNLSLEQSFVEAVERFQQRWDEMMEIAHEQKIEIQTQSPAEWEQLWSDAKESLDKRC